MLEVLTHSEISWANIGADVVVIVTAIAGAAGLLRRSIVRSLVKEMRGNGGEKDSPVAGDRMVRMERAIEQTQGLVTEVAGRCERTEAKVDAVQSKLDQHIGQHQAAERAARTEHIQELRGLP